jgi:hypothetical protein
MGKRLRWRKIFVGIAAKQNRFLVEAKMQC